VLFGAQKLAKGPQRSLPEPEAELTAVETLFGASKQLAARSFVSSESVMTQIVACWEGLKSELRSAEGSTEPNRELNVVRSAPRSAGDVRMLVQ